MLYILIAAAWVAIGAFFAVVVCRAAARGDAAMTVQPPQRRQVASFAGLTLFEEGAEPLARDERLGRGRARAGSRGRRAGCVTAGR
jgi:hypothetical protein